jgi:hypothetical protein
MYISGRKKGYWGRQPSDIFVSVISKPSIFLGILQQTLLISLCSKLSYTAIPRCLRREMGREKRVVSASKIGFSTASVTDSKRSGIPLQ